jgi:tetratricopeptide (TPR) repeat protein
MGKRQLHISLIALFSIALLAPNNSEAQALSNRKVKKFVRKGRKAYRKEEYWKSKSYYDKVTASNPDKSQYWFEAGLAYYDSQVQREEALVYFEKALELSQTDTIPEILFYAAKTYHFTSEFEKAIDYYNLFLKNVENTKKGQQMLGLANRNRTYLMRI